MPHRWIRPALLAGVLCPGPLLAQSFEGVITSQVTPGPGKPPMEMVTMTKGAMSRMDINSPGGEVYMLTDSKTATTMTVMPAQKIYMVMDLKQMAEHMQQTTPGDKPPPPPKITKTGQSETIAGYKCEHYLMGDAQNVDVCAASGLGFLGFAGGGGPMGGMMGGGGMGPPSLPAGYQEIVKEFKDGFMPLKMEKIDGDKRQTVLLVTKIEKKTLEESLFIVPDGYQEMKMPGM